MIESPEQFNHTAIQNAAFLYPVINNKIYLGQRNTEPYKGLFGPFGGKSELVTDSNPMLKDFFVHDVLNVVDDIAVRLGYEFGHDAAVREFFEEAFQAKSDLSVVTNLVCIHSITDFWKQRMQNIQLYLGKVARKDFNQSTREIGAIKPLEELTSSELYPLAMLGLVGILDLLRPPYSFLKQAKPYQGIDLEKQITQIDEEVIRAYMQPPRRTSIWGVWKILSKSVLQNSAPRGTQPEI